MLGVFECVQFAETTIQGCENAERLYAELKLTQRELAQLKVDVLRKLLAPDPTFLARFEAAQRNLHRGHEEAGVEVDGVGVEADGTDPSI